MIPRCSHNNIILGCPYDFCYEQNEYLAEQERLLALWSAQQIEVARQIVDGYLMGIESS